MLNCYRNITPNLSGTHYYFKYFLSYTNMLLSHRLAILPTERYDINKGFIRVKLGIHVTTRNYKEVTYLVNTDDEVCYHVTNSIVQSGYVYYGVKVDEWGTYISKVNLRNINIKKCNRKISDNGIYDDITLSNNYLVKNYSEQLIGVNDIAIVFSVLLKSSMSDTTIHKMFMINYTDFFFDASIDASIDVLSTLKEIQRIFTEEGEEQTENYTPTLLKTYIVLRKYIRHIRHEDNKYAISKYGSVSQRIYVDEVLPNYSYEDIEVDADINKTYYIGVTNIGIKAKRQVNNKISARFSFATSYKSISASVSIGQDKIDLTKSFELDISQQNNNQEDDISRTINRVASVLGSIAQIGIGSVAGSPLAIASGSRKAITGLSSLFEQKQSAPSQEEVGSSDAYLNYYYEGDKKLYYLPYKISEATSLINEELKAHKTGANFNEYVDELESVFDKELLGTGEDTDTYIVASVDANDIPTTAIDTIEGRFASGIYLQYLV